MGRRDSGPGGRHQASRLASGGVPLQSLAGSADRSRPASALGCSAVDRTWALEAAAHAADDLAEATRVVFQQHPQMAIFTSFPGLGELPAARLLAEIGDDATRFADARGLKAYAGAAPVTRASGKKLVVLHRKVKNQRLAAIAICGPSPRYASQPVPELTVIGGAWPGIDTPPRNATYSTGSWAASITACRPVRPSTRSGPSQQAPRTRRSPLRLDS